MNTKHYNDSFSLRCSYCHEKAKMENPGYDDEVSYYCNCEKAKLERKMNNEIYEMTKNIKKKYEKVLEIDNNKIKEMKIKGHIHRAVFDSIVSIGSGFTKAEEIEEAFKDAMKKVF